MSRLNYVPEDSYVGSEAYYAALDILDNMDDSECVRILDVLHKYMMGRLRAWNNANGRHLDFDDSAFEFVWGQEAMDVVYCVQGYSSYIDKETETIAYDELTDEVIARRVKEAEDEKVERERIRKEREYQRAVEIVHGVREP